MQIEVINFLFFLLNQTFMKSMVTCSFLLKKPFPIVLLAIFCLSQGISQERKRITNQDKNGTII
ncbi:MAG: hypothetical protein V1257_06905, partial [Candidatus Neomarinimicrobiota bacterium]|nr:hypothetical protein [Candidatus Neomarinimicrobiota bacterium]